MHVLITRPHFQAQEMKRQLDYLGCQVSIDPLLEVEPVNYNEKIYHNSSALVVTSLQASLRIVQADPIDKSKPIYAVGDATAAPLKRNGYENVLVASGDAQSLIKLVLEKHAPSDGLITYLSGWHITQDLAWFLAMQGYSAQRVVCYKTHLVGHFAETTLLLLEREKINVIVFLSARTAQAFSRLSMKHNLSSKLHNVTGIVFSENIVDALPANRFREIIITNSYTQNAVYEEIENLMYSKV